MGRTTSTLLFRGDGRLDGGWALWHDASHLGPSEGPSLEGWISGMTGIEDAEVLSKFSRVIVWANDKGGVGKTSTSVNCAGQFAKNGFKVLLVDMNNQGNAVIDLGCEKDPINDKGSALAQALTFNGRLEPKPVPGRDGFFIITGGEMLESVPLHIGLQRSKDGHQADLALRRALEPIAEDFDLVFIDTPPENLLMLDLALAVARWLMIPTKTDSASISGMRRVAAQFARARRINPCLALMGAVLFATTRNATRIHKTAYEEIERSFGGKSPLFKAFIGHSEALAQDARKRDNGKLVHELEAMAADQPQWWEALRSGTKEAHRVSLTASTVSTDYSNVCLEMINIINRAEQAEAQEAQR